MKAIHGTFVSTDAVMEIIMLTRDKFVQKYSPNAYTADQLTPEGKAVYEALTELYKELFSANNNSQRI